MMHAKAIVFNDKETAAKILATDSPEEQRDLGRLVKNYDGAVWNPIRYAVVRRANYLKFSKSATIRSDANGDKVPLRRLLVGTCERELVEASPVDRLWGVGFAADEAEEHRDEWGENLLGRALEEVRELLKVEDEKREAKV